MCTDIDTMSTVTALLSRMINFCNLQLLLIVPLTVLCRDAEQQDGECRNCVAAAA